VANFIPLKSYLAMLDEGRKWNKDLFGREGWTRRGASEKGWR
jgi:hypothetical protein